MLERCLKRLEWEQAREREAKEAADEAERERVAMAQIDWHDFVIVETIDFYDDEDEELPPPLSLKEIIMMNKARPFDEVMPYCVDRQRSSGYINCSTCCNPLLVVEMHVTVCDTCITGNYLDCMFVYEPGSMFVCCRQPCT